jgi:spore maturation protein CgeB/glycosyltransferase involved in cell wall biosynthesis
MDALARQSVEGALVTADGTWRVLLLDTKQSNPNHYICLAIERALTSDPRVASVHRVDLGHAITLAKRNRCNLFFAFDGEELHPDICARLRVLCGLSVLWVTEDPYELPVNLRNQHLFDRVFTNDSGSVAAYGGRATHLPFAASPWLHQLKVRPPEECRYDLLFVGTAWPNRVELLKKLLKEIGGLRSKLALPTNPHLPPVDLPLPNSSINWRTPSLEFARLANTSRVVLTLHRDFSTSPGAPTMAATPGPRLFELAMAGTCQLVDGGLAELSEYFDPQRELAVFTTAEQALEKLRYLLKHPNERTAIAIAAKARALREHTYEHRMATILDHLDQSHSRLEVADGIELPAPAPAKKRVLLVAHNALGQGSWGGVEVYVDWIRRTLSPKFELWTYVPLQGSSGQHTVLRDADGIVVESHDFGAPLAHAALSCPLRETAFARLLLVHNIQALHMHHLIGHPPSLPLIAQSLGVAAMMSLHDYYTVCEHFTLVGHTGSYCGVEKLTESDCDYCLGATLSAKPGATARRRSWMRRVLTSFDVLHANTLGVRDRMTSVYPSLAQFPGWSVMGIPVAKLPAMPAPSSEGPLRVAVPGNFTRFKGGHMLMTVFRQLSGEPIEFTLLGRIDDGLQEVLRAEGYEQVHINGMYLPEQLHEQLAGHHVSLHTSLWPETWCLTLSESWRAGLVPIVTRMGALGERVRDGENGFVIPHDRPAALVNLLRDLARDRRVIERLRGGVTDSDVLYEETHAAWLTERYERLSRQSVVTACGLPPTPLTATQAGHLHVAPSWLDAFSSQPREAKVIVSSTALPPAAPVVSPKPSPETGARLPARAGRFLLRYGLFATLRRSVEFVRTKSNRPHGGV